MTLSTIYAIPKNAIARSDSRQCKPPWTGTLGKCERKKPRIASKALRGKTVGLRPMDEDENEDKMVDEFLRRSSLIDRIEKGLVEDFDLENLEFGSRDHSGKVLAINALNHARDPKYGLVATTDDEGRPVGFLSFRSHPKSLDIKSLGTIGGQKGGGRKLLEKLGRMAIAEGKGLTVESYDDAIGFYKKMGFRKKSTGLGSSLEISFEELRERLGARKDSIYAVPKNATARFDARKKKTGTTTGTPKPCGRGWVGTKPPGCERPKKGSGKKATPQKTPQKGGDSRSKKLEALREKLDQPQTEATLKKQAKRQSSSIRSGGKKQSPDDVKAALKEKLKERREQRAKPSASKATEGRNSKIILKPDAAEPQELQQLRQNATLDDLLGYAQLRVAQKASQSSFAAKPLAERKAIVRSQLEESAKGDGFDAMDAQEALSSASKFNAAVTKATVESIENTLATGGHVPESIIDEVTGVRKVGLSKAFAKARKRTSAANKKELEQAESKMKLFEQALASPVDPARAAKHKPMMSRQDAEAYASGTPLAEFSFYHGGTSGGIASITTSGVDIAANQDGIYGSGFYMAAAPQVAQAYASASALEDGAMISAKVAMKRPLIIENSQDMDAALNREIGLTPLSSDPEIGSALEEFGDPKTAAFSAMARLRGYDGIYVKDLGYLVAFDQKQVVAYETASVNQETQQKAAAINDYSTPETEELKRRLQNG